MEGSQSKIAKIQAFGEVKKAIQLLLVEIDTLSDEHKKRDYLRKKIEDRFKELFQEKLSIEEYESIIFDIFLAKNISMGDNQMRTIERVVYEAIYSFNIRNKKLMNEKINLVIAADPKKKAQITKAIEEKYKEIVSTFIREIVKKYFNQGVFDRREILQLIKKERYELDNVTISKIFTQESLPFQDRIRSQLKEELAARRAKRAESGKKLKELVPTARTPQQILEMTIEKEKKRKEEFIANYCYNFAFECTENYIDGDVRVFVHSGAFNERIINVISHAYEGEIIKVSLFFENPTGKKQEEIFVDIDEVRDLEKWEEKLEFVKRKVNVLQKFFKLETPQEIIWLLSNVLTEECNLPFKTFEHLSFYFIEILRDLESALQKLLIQKALKKSH